MASERTPSGRQGPAHLMGLDGVALKPTEHDLASVAGESFDRLVIDFEGRSAFPSPRTLARVRDHVPRVRVTVPVRADGFDPLGDQSVVDGIPPGLGRVYVAGNPAYLSAREHRRPIAERLGAAVRDRPQAWVGTESLERVALATGRPQFELLAPDTLGTLRRLRDAGFEGTLAVYAPVVQADDDDVILDALGPYVARRATVVRRLPNGAARDAAATGRARRLLLEGCENYGLVGTSSTVRARADKLREAGATLVIGYPARGLTQLVNAANG